MKTESLLFWFKEQTNLHSNVCRVREQRWWPKPNDTLRRRAHGCKFLTFTKRGEGELSQGSKVGLWHESMPLKPSRPLDVCSPVPRGFPWLTGAVMRQIHIRTETAETLRSRLFPIHIQHRKSVNSVSWTKPTRQKCNDEQTKPTFFFSFSPLHLAERSMGLSDHRKLIWEGRVTQRSFGPLIGTWLVQEQRGRWPVSMTEEGAAACSLQRVLRTSKPALSLHTLLKHLSASLHPIFEETQLFFRILLACYSSGTAVQSAKIF